MLTVYIRHNLVSTPEALKYLWEERLIAIHFQSLRSVNPDDYDAGGKQALKKLWKYCNSGAVVGATFRSIKPHQMLVGEIEKDSKVELLELSKLFDHINYVYKVVKLQNVQEVSYIDYPLLAAIQPRLATVTGWPSAEKYLLAILGKQKVNWSVSSLDPSQLEVICYEFLKMQGVVKALLLPIGRGLMDIDIYGIGENNERIVAQVTHSTNPIVIQDKLVRLKEYQSENSRLFFFAPEILDLKDSVVRHISIEQVFSVLSNEKNVYRRMISQMLNW